MRFPCPTNRVASALGAQVKINIFPLQKKKSVRGRIDVESSAAWSRSAPAAYLLPPGRWWQIFSRQKRRLEVLQQSTQRGIIAVLSGNPAMFDVITGTSENFTWNDFFFYRSLSWPGDGCSSNLRNVVGWSRLEQCDTTGSWSLCWPGDVSLAFERVSCRRHFVWFRVCGQSSFPPKWTNRFIRFVGCL